MYDKDSARTLTSSSSSFGSSIPYKNRRELRRDSLILLLDVDYSLRACLRLLYAARASAGWDRPADWQARACAPCMGILTYPATMCRTVSTLFTESCSGIIYPFISIIIFYSGNNINSYIPPADSASDTYRHHARVLYMPYQ